MTRSSPLIKTQLDGLCVWDVEFLSFGYVPEMKWEKKPKRDADTFFACFPDSVSITVGKISEDL